MILQTEIKIQALEQTIHYGDGLLFLGSCFADEVGDVCKGLGFNAMVNPFGVLYNPFSIANAIHRLGTGKPFEHEDVIRVGGEFYCSFSHNTMFWRPTETAFLEEANRSLAESHAHFANSKWVVVSLGTAWVYRHRKTLEVVANCHKLPSQLFDRFRLSVPAMVTVLSDFVKVNPEKQFIFTVSPLRHLKDGLHENQLSKSALLLTIDEIVQKFANAHYFPAYEILLDELRDYRFYKEDMVHPSEQAVHYIWERFLDFAIDAKEKPAMKAANELKQMLHHKPVFPESEANRKYVSIKEQKTKALSEQFPQVIIPYL